MRRAEVRDGRAFLAFLLSEYENPSTATTDDLKLLAEGIDPLSLAHMVADAADDLIKDRPAAIEFLQRRVAEDLELYGDPARRQ